MKKFNLKDYVFVHPGFGQSTNHPYPTRLWPVERYAEVIDHLINKYGLKVILSGSKEEKSINDSIFSQVSEKNRKKVIQLDGMLEMNSLAYVLSKSKLLIGPSTCVTHIATAYDIPIVEMAGKGYLYEWHPWTSKDRYRIFYHNEVCTACNKMNCRKKTIECMKAITSEEVINAVDSLLK
jgi:ADP-heptose:LPS heptosyltransferase